MTRFGARRILPCGRSPGKARFPKMGSTHFPPPAPQRAKDAGHEIAAPRIDWWDRLRILAFLDIAGFHLHGTHPLWGIGLPTFLLLAIILASFRGHPPNTRKFLQVRVERLLIPWVFWSIALSFALIAWNRGENLDRVFAWPMLLAGPMVHLWFLPYILVAGIGAHLVDRATQNVPLILFVLISIAVTLGLVWWGPMSGFGYPFRDWGFALPLVPMALGVGRILGRAASPAVARRQLLQYLMVFVALALLIAIAIGPPSNLIGLRRYLISLAAIVACLFLPVWDDRVSSHIEKLLLAMYILHVPLERLLFYRLESILPFAIPLGVEAAMVTVVSIAVAWALRLTPLRRFL